jgi:hypothetical protein
MNHLCGFLTDLGPSFESNIRPVLFENRTIEGPVLTMLAPVNSIANSIEYFEARSIACVWIHDWSALGCG